MPAIRQTSLLFADIEDSTRIAQLIAESAGEVAYADFSLAYESLLRDACSAHHGAVGGTWGDDFYATFSSPRDALGAAFAIQMAAATQDWPHGARLRIRIGLHHGRVIESSNGLVGIELHRAMRICSLALGAEVVASAAFVEATRGELPAKYAAIDLGLRSLKGFAFPEPLFLIAREGWMSRRVGERNPLGDWERPLNPIVGRESEIAALSELLHRPDVRLVSVLGPGGVGKTRLCEELTALEQERFLDGVYMVNLSAVEDPALVSRRTAQALGLTPEQGRGDADQIADLLADRQVLLVFDNFEHLRPAAGFVRDLLTRSSRVKALVTSRTPLGIRGEQRFELLPLATSPEDRGLSGQPAPAAELFMQRALATRPALALDPADRSFVDDICTTLDGLPLAIELAAAQVDNMSLGTLARGLRIHPLRLLVDPDQDYPARQATMTSTVSWSYQLIEDEQDRALLDALATFFGSFSAQQAADLLSQLGRPSHLDDVTSAIERLRRRSLVQVVREAEPRRYRLLRVIREFAMARLEDAGQADAARQAHLAVHVRIAQQAEFALQGESQLEVMDSLAQDIENIRGALACASSTPDLAPAGIRLATSLTVYWWHGHIEEGSHWLSSLLALLPAPSKVNPRELGRVAQAHLTVALLQLYGGSLANARQHVDDCLAISDSNSRTLAIQALATALAGMIEAAGGQSARGERLCGDGVARLDAMALHWMLAIALEWRGEAALRAGHDGLAETSWERSVSLFRELGDRWLQAAPLARLGDLALDRGDLARAGELLAESIALLRAVGTGAGSAQVLASLGRLARAEGRSRDARMLAAESLRAASASGSWLEVDLGLSLLASLCSDGPHPADAIEASRLLGAAARIRTAAGPLASSTIQRGDAHLAVLLRTTLGTAAFEAAWAEGHASTTVEAVALAIGLAGNADE